MSQGERSEICLACLSEQQQEQDTAVKCELGEGLSMEQGE